ncbi:MAG: PAS domain-containing protein [Sphingomonas bacterium]|nr:PAS domain-containing protein [Sphingomonas bacterium]
MKDRGVNNSSGGRNAGEPATPKRADRPANPPPSFDFASILAISDALPVMIAYCDASLRYRFINRSLADWFERPRSDILGRTMREVLGEGAYPMRVPMLEAALGGERQWFASDYLHPTRGPLAVQTEYIPQFGPDGRVAGLVMLVEDITEQRIVGRALKESEARFRRIADSAPMPMWVTRLDRSRDFVNDAYVDLMGGSRAEAQRVDWVSRIHPDDRKRMIAETLAGERSGESYSIEARFEFRPGDYRWMRGVSQPRRDAEGRLLGYIGVATDITLIKQAEIELRRQVDERTAALSASEARFRAIFDAVMEIIVLLKPDGTVVQLNRTRADWRDPNPEAAIGAKLWHAPTLKDFPQHQGMVRDAVAAAARGETVVREVAMEREGHPTATLDVSFQPVRDAAGTIVFILFEARDITELKAAQEQLRQSQKMEALGQLTGGIAHDFNNLLTVVVGGLDLISKKVEDPKLKRYADNALSAAERGARLTAQLLAFSRVQKLEVRPTYIAPLIENMRSLLRNVLGPGVAKRFDLDREMLSVMADPTQLELAVLNLAINARDAMPDGGTLYIQTHGVSVADDPELADGEYIEVGIRDTGTGMPPEVAARAFEPFFTTKEVGKGTGLGLSMVYGVARQSGGTARIESVPGEGTTVKLYFRRADHPGQSADEPLSAVAEAAVRCEGEILVIDDDPDVRSFIVASLVELGYRVREASDGTVGLALFEDRRPDLVVIDFVMPGLSGAEVAQRILDQAPDQRLLFVSGYSETAAITRAAPDASLLTKPFRAVALDAAVRAALGVTVRQD